MEHSFTELTGNLCQMFSYALKNWGGLHPFAVHFPIVLLIIVPPFILAGMVWAARWRSLLGFSFIAMLLGTISIYIAVSTGNFAAEPLEIGKDVVATLTDHVVLAERAQRNFTILTALFLSYLVGRFLWLKESKHLIHKTILIVYLLIYILNLIILFNAAHYGGKLVHKHGIHSSFYKVAP